MTDLLAAQARCFGPEPSVDVYVHIWHPDCADAEVPVDRASALLMLAEASIGSDGTITDGPLPREVEPHAGDFGWLVANAGRFIESVQVVPTDHSVEPPHADYDGGLDPSMSHGTIRIHVRHVAWLLHIPDVPHSWSSVALDVPSMILQGAPADSPAPVTPDSGYPTVPRDEVSVDDFVARVRDLVGPETRHFRATIGRRGNRVRATVWGSAEAFGIESIVEQQLSPLIPRVLELLTATRVDEYFAALSQARRMVVAESDVPLLPFAGLEPEDLLDSEVRDESLVARLCERIRDEL